MPPSHRLPINIRYASEADAQALGSMTVASFYKRPLFRSCYPGMGPEDPAIVSFKRLNVLQKLENSAVHAFAATVVKEEDGDAASSKAEEGEVVGYAFWIIPPSLSDRIERPSGSGISAEASQEAASMMEHAPNNRYGMFMSSVNEIKQNHLREDDISALFLFNFSFLFPSCTSIGFLLRLY